MFQSRTFKVTSADVSSSCHSSIPNRLPITMTVDCRVEKYIIILLFTLIFKSPVSPVQIGFDPDLRISLQNTLLASVSLSGQ